MLSKLNSTSPVYCPEEGRWKVFVRGVVLMDDAEASEYQAAGHLITPVIGPIAPPDDSISIMMPHC